MEFSKICRADFDKMCRTCLKIDENVLLDSNTQLFEKLHYSIGLKLEEDSELPHVFCNSCKDNINIMYDFKRLCLYSQQLLADAIKGEFSNQKNNTQKDINVKTEQVFENNYSINEISNLNSTGSCKDIKQNVDKQDSPHNSTTDNQIELFNENVTDDNISEHSFKNDSDKDDNSISLQDKSSISCEDEDLSDSNSISNESISTKLTSLMTSKTIKLPDINSYKCLECDKICKKRLALKTHMLLHIPKVYRLKYCAICDKTYTRNDTYMKHLKNHQYNNSQIKELCTLCGKSFIQLKQHVQRVHSQNKSYHCSKCDSKFTVKIALTDHIKKVHSGKKNMKLLLCPECGKTFQRRRDLESHAADHTGKKPYKCTLCKLEFKWTSGLNYHKKTKHSLQPEKIPKDNTPCVKEPCKFCGKSFTNLRYHIIRIHSENKPYNCTKCDRKYPLKSYLKEHVDRVHNGIIKPKKKSLCPQCGKTFSCPRDLESHIAFHAGIKLHKCTLCKREFTFKQGLTEHMKAHQVNRVKNFACTYCDKKFTLNSILRNHIRIHTGERPFSCKICQKSFTQEAALRTHMKMHKIQK